MKDPVSIKKSSHLTTGLDFEQLRLKGISYAQELSGHIWTDFNEHDPGVTLLEHLCFSLTDLAYRANFDIRDILYANDGNGKPQIENAFFDAVDIFPTSPIIARDYRQLLIDRIHEIKNAWVDPIKDQSYGYRGLYRIRIQMAQYSEQLAKDTVKAVEDLLAAHRNLAEDFEEILVLGTEHLEIKANISIQPDAFGEKVMARILFALESVLNPGVRFHSKDELIRDGWREEDMYDGPEPYHGFIKASELKPLPESTQISKLREIVNKVNGVKLVNELKVWKDGVRIHGDEIIPSPNNSLSLHPDMFKKAGSNDLIQLFREEGPIDVDTRQTIKQLDNLLAKSRKGNQLKMTLRTPQPVSKKRLSEIGVYHSFQRLLPAVYGLGEFGLPSTANRERRAKAKQLKAYLLFFEQLLADYLAQLTNVRKLFSISESEEPAFDHEAGHERHANTYFSQFPHDIPDIHQLLNLPEDEAVIRKLLKFPSAEDDKHPPVDPPETLDIEQVLTILNDRFDPADDRKNRFLDHLLARFGEAFNGDYLKKLNRGNSEGLAHQLIRNKATFLRKYPELSSQRSKAFNYTLPSWKVDNVSGLKKRITLLLNINPPQNTTDEHPLKSYYNRSLSKAPTTDLLSGWAGQATKVRRKKSVKLSRRDMLKYGGDPGNYEFEKTGKKYKLLFKKGEGEDPIEILSEHSLDKCSKVKDKLVHTFQQINAEGEGFFLVENILLRPVGKPGSLLVLDLGLMNSNGADQGTLLLRSPSFSAAAYLKDLQPEIIILGTNEDNYSVEAVPGGFVVALTKKRKIVLLSDVYLKLETAVEAKKQIKQRLTEIRDTTPSEINNALRFEPERFAGNEVPASFYSLRLSLVIPNWPAMFQGEDFRNFFKRLVALNVPAHLSVDFYWLGISEMVAFEATFKNWLSSKAAGKDVVTIRDNAQRLVNQLRKNKKITNEESKSKDALFLEKRIPENILESLGKSLGYGFMFDQQEFKIFSGIGESTERALKESEVKNWRQLDRADPEQLKHWSKDQAKIWGEEVRLAIENKWEELIDLQKWPRGSRPKLSPAKTALDQRMEALLVNAATALAALGKYFSGLENQQLPQELIRLVLETGGNELVFKTGDFRIFSGLTPGMIQELQHLGIRDWNGLANIRDRSWESIVHAFPEAAKNIDHEQLKQEASLANEGKWADLKALQRTQKGKITALEAALNNTVVRLANPANETDRKSLIDLTDQLAGQHKELRLAKQAVSTLKKYLEYDQVLTNDDFEIIDTLDELTSNQLKKLSISNWRRLGRKEIKPLKSLLAESGIISEEAAVAYWIKQAGLAAKCNWAALKELQEHKRLHVSGAGGSNSKVEQYIKDWLAQHGAEPTNAPES